MNKTEFVTKVVENLALDGVVVTKKNMNVYIDTIVDTIVEAMLSGEEVKIAQFGTFSSVEKAERTARNPLTGEAVKVAAHKAPKFKFSKAVKDAVR